MGMFIVMWIVVAAIIGALTGTSPSGHGSTGVVVAALVVTCVVGAVGGLSRE